MMDWFHGCSDRQGLLSWRCCHLHTRRGWNPSVHVLRWTLSSQPWDAGKIATCADAAGARVSTGANNKTSSPHIRVQLIHLPNHSSLKISANWERALQCMICPRPHRKPVVKLEIEPKAPGSRIWAWLWAWGHPGTLPREVLGQHRQQDIGLTKTSCLHLFKPSLVVGCACSRCSAGLMHP